MERKNATPPLAELARRQWGLITRAQLAAAGMGDKGVTEWVQSGRLRRLYRGIYAFGHDRLRVEGCWLAAVMACGRGAVLSHRDAAQLWELRQSNSALIDVTVPSTNGRVKRKGIRVHRSGRLGADEVTTRLGIPVTTVARTLLDLADVLPRQALRRAITEAEYRGRLDTTTLTAVVENNPGRRGAKLRTALEAAGHRTRSPTEDRFLAFIERWGVEEPETGVWIGEYEVDFLWRKAGLVVETDGLDEHATREAVRRDRLRDRVLWRAGFRTMRLTGADLDEPAAVLGDLAQAGVGVASRPRVSSKPSPKRASTSSASAT
jgi:predicted transcriptional regulator of viral defense system